MLRTEAKQARERERRSCKFTYPYLCVPFNCGVDTLQQPSVVVQHYGILEGDRLKHYVIMQGLVFFMILVLCLDAFFVASRLKKEWRHEDLQASAIFEPCSDLVCCALLLWYVTQSLQRQLASKDATVDVLNQLDNIPWSSASVALDEKMNTFLDTIGGTDGLLALIIAGEFDDRVCMAILMINLLRVIQCTSLHPRLALLTGTVANAGLSLLCLCFARISFAS